MLYFLVTIYYVSSYTVAGIDPDDRWALTPEFFMRWFILACVFYFAFFEFVCMLRDGGAYFLDIFNYNDWLAFVLNFYLVYVTATKEAP